jgi:hypothetical protein
LGILKDLENICEQEFFYPNQIQYALVKNQIFLYSSVAPLNTEPEIGKILKDEM